LDAVRAAWRELGMLTLLSIIAGLAGLGCSIFIIVEAFQDEIWKGIVSLLCCLYLLYYGLFEWEHDWKWPIVLGAIFGDAIAIGIQRL
jgi:hypothetical protein